MSDLRPRREKFQVRIPLPSGGFASRTAFPDGKIIVYPWDSSIDRWLLDAMQRAPHSKRDLVIFDLMSQLCNLNGCPLKDFILGDVNTVLLVARSLETENKLDYVAVCPSCGQEESDTIVVPDELGVIGEKGPTYSGTDTVVLPDCQDTVEIRPLRIGDLLDIKSRTPENKAAISDDLALQLMPIVSVNSTQADRMEELVTWHAALSPRDLTRLEAAIDEYTPHLSQVIKQQCENPACRREYEFNIKLDADFFRTGRLG